MLNMMQLPLALAAGYVGDLKIEGLVGAVAGSPLSLRVRNVCLVLRPTDVPWDNELLRRFAKEFVVALWQSVLVPAYDGKPVKKASSSAFISPGRWIAVRSFSGRVVETHVIDRLNRAERRADVKPPSPT